MKATKNDYLVSCKVVKEAVGETSQKDPTDVSMDDRVSLSMGLNGPQ